MRSHTSAPARAAALPHESRNRCFRRTVYGSAESVPMKQVALASTLLVAVGIAGVAFVLASTMSKPRFPPTLGVAPGEATGIPRVTASSTAALPDSERPSVSALESPAPASPEVASVPAGPLTTLPGERAQAKPLDTEKGVRSLSKDHCGGRTIKSITVLPDGTAQMQC